ncbi:secreted antigen Ts8B1 [Echinococcus multilocularis]|uniref:Secreted antigen Ts8B1 n=1 Tax=Echinococcus multilocularis TaxID=6211 RepID=U6HKU3_ECHMU|nr:secreted antigen Ts8B1 [Echinococcus multilocularis]CDS37959.1 secreted antigen Ts8B1 [Echinococcus multilocularis]
MGASGFLALAILAITVVAASADEKTSDDPKKEIMMLMGETRRFFREDPLGQKIVDHFQELVSICKALRERVRKRLGEYLKGLENE